MAFFRKKRADVRQAKKNGKKTDTSYPGDILTITSLVSPPSFEDASYTSSVANKQQRQSKSRWITPRNQQQNSTGVNNITKTPSTVESSIFGSRSTTSSSLLSNLNIVATDDIEITTLESQQALVQQREAIRRQLFDPVPSTARRTSTAHNETTNNNNLRQSSYPNRSNSGSRNVRSVLYKTATNDSQEILPNGSIVPDTKAPKSTSSLAERFSLPLSSVSQSFESHDDVIVPIDLAARSYDDSIEKKTPSPAIMARSLTDPRDLVKSSSPVSRSSKSPVKQQHPLDRKGRSSLPTSPNNISHSSRPMDERQVDHEVEYQRNKGKSPLKGMPDDERLEYQRDEIDDEMAPAVEDDDEEGSTGHEEEDESVESPTATEEEYSVMVPPAKTSGIVAGGALVAAAVGWGANAVDRACLGDDELDDDDTAAVRMAPSFSKYRPKYLSESDCKKFLRRITRNGFVLLNLITSGDSWTGRTVTMCIAKGSQEHPAQLEWTTVTGGQNHEISVSSVDLMDILTIDTDGLPEDMDEEATATAGGGENCIFTITTDDGHVFLFEANSKEERDRIVNGLKTIIARWARQMVAGEVSATSELYAVYQTPTLVIQSELSVSPNPAYTMNRMAHRLLDL